MRDTGFAFISTLVCIRYIQRLIFYTSQKFSPITLDELVILWKLHRLHADCDTSISKVKVVKQPHSNEFVGFQSLCRYQYVLKSLIAQRKAR